MTYRSMESFGAFDPVKPGCGTTAEDVRRSQRALNALGFTDGSGKPIVVDGQWGSRSSEALGKFSVARGLGFLGTTAQGNICKTLWEEYALVESAPPGTCPPGQQRVMGACVPIPSIPGVTTPATQQPATQQPAGPTACKPGEYGVPPFCYSWPAPTPGQPGQPVSCPPGFTGTFPACLPPGILPAQKPQIEPPPSPPTSKPAAKKGLTRNAKIALGVGGVAVAGLVAALLFFGGKKESDGYSPNFRRKSKAKKLRASGRRRAKAKKRVHHQSKHIIDIKVGRKVRAYGHATPPKRHRRKGATKAKDYADPEHFKYPIKTYKQVRAALSYFARFKDRYPTKVRLTIAKRLNDAKEKFGIGGKEVDPGIRLRARKAPIVRRPRKARKR